MKKPYFSSSQLTQTLKLSSFIDSHHPHPQTLTDSSTSSSPPPKLTHHRQNSSWLCLLMDWSGYRSWLCLLVGFSFRLLDFQVVVPHHQSSSPSTLNSVGAWFLGFCRSSPLSVPHCRSSSSYVLGFHQPSSPTHPFRWPSSPTHAVFVIGDFLFCL